ncbi:MAG: hypothetical protein IPM06_18160 [Rhizobiales bacterium]|nr:hypothetical protein [Hyphomicrobiales bacterium]
MRPPIITNVDREWAMAQMPSWCQRGDLDELCGEIVDDGGWLDREEVFDGERQKPNWSAFVAEEIEKFEQHYAGEQRSPDEWSSIWRKGWWPKVSPRKRFPKSAPKEFHPFYRKGTQGFAIALRLATDDERRMWVRFGVAQIKPDDPRVKTIESAIKREAAE